MLASRLRPLQNATIGVIWLLSAAGTKAAPAPGARAPHLRPGTRRPPPGTVAPRLVQAHTPPLPAWALSGRVRGPVLLELTIDEHGAVTAAKALTDPGPGLGPLAAKAARSLRFTPARVKGKAVRCLIRFTLSFAGPKAIRRPRPRATPAPRTRPRPEQPPRARTAPRPRTPAPPRSAPRPARPRTPPSRPVYATTVIGRRALTAASDQTVRDRDFLLFPRQTASDLLLMVPQLHISQHSGSGKGHQIFLRGFDAEHGQDLYIGFDGVPINEPSHIHGIGYTDLHFIVPELVRRIRILKGPYDVRYGAFATAGAVNFELKDRLDRSYIDVSGGSFSTLQGTLAFSPDLQALDLLVAVQGFSTRGYTSFGDWKGVRSMARVSKALGGGRLALTLVAYASLWNAADAVPARLVDRGDLDFYGGLDDTDGGASQRQHLAVSYKKDWKGNTLLASLYLAQRRSRIFTNYTYLLEHPDHGDQTEQADQRWILGGRAEWERELRWRKLRVTTLVGAVFRSDWVDMTLHRTRARQRWDRGAEVSARLMDVGSYARVEVSPVRWFRVLAGLRYDHLAYDVTGVQDLVRPSGAIDHDQPVNGTAGRNVFAPKGTLIFSPAKQLDLFVNFGTGFHPLDARDAVLNPDQRVPLAYAGELGFRTRLWKRLDLAGSAWGTYMEQEIFFDPTLGRSVDTGQSRRLGGELEARLRILRWLHLHLDGSYTDARLVESGDPVPGSPNLLIRGGVTVYKRFRTRVRFFQGSVLRAGVRVRYIGARPLAGGQRSEDATLVDLLIGYRLRWFALELAMDNLLDQRWRDAQYHYVSRASLSEPDTGVAGYHFTAGTPFAVRATLRVFLP